MGSNQAYTFTTVGLLLLLLEAVGDLDNLVAGDRGIAPAFHLHPFPLEILIDRKEMGDLFEHVGIDLGVVPNVGVARVVLADSENLLIRHSLIEHFQEADRANLHDAAREAGRIDQDQNIQRVSIVAQRRRDKAVISRVMYRGIEVTVEAKDVQALVIFVFVDALGRNLNHGVNDLGRIVADGQFQIVNHKLCLIKPF